MAARRGQEDAVNKIGLYLINVNITDITDESDYIYSIGKKAAAEGVFDAIALTPEQIEERAARHAEEDGEGESCDGGPEKESGCGAEVREDRIFLIRGTGAVIYS